jgi:hypothetical protein
MLVHQKADDNGEVMVEVKALKTENKKLDFPSTTPTHNNANECGQHSQIEMLCKLLIINSK